MGLVSYITSDHNEMYVQDTVHIGTKLKTSLTNAKIRLVLGNHVATPLLLKHTIENVSKDKNLLTIGDIQPDDKMNFIAEAVEKITT